MAAWQVTEERNSWLARLASLVPYAVVVVIWRVLYVPVAAFLLVGRTATLPAFGQFFSAGARESPSGPEVANQTFVFVNGSDFPVTYTWVIRKAEGLASAPRRVAQLSSVTMPSVVYREDLLEHLDSKPVP